MSNRRAVSVLETLVVIGIIAVLIGMLLPAVGAARRRALETVCKNNLGQVNLAVAQLVETQKRLPATAELLGGAKWTNSVITGRRADCSSACSGWCQPARIPSRWP